MRKRITVVQRRTSPLIIKKIDHSVDENNQGCNEEEYHEQEEESLLDHQDEYIENDLKDYPREDSDVNEESLIQNYILLHEIETSSLFFMDIEYGDTSCEALEKG